MSLRRLNRSRLVSITVISAISCALILASIAPLTITATAQPEPQARMGQPESGKPIGTVENLDVVKRRPKLHVRAIDPDPSTMRSPKNPLEPRNGRKVGDAWSTQQIGSAGATPDGTPDKNAQLLKSPASKTDTRQRKAAERRSHHTTRFAHHQFWTTIMCRPSFNGLWRAHRTRTN